MKKSKSLFLILLVSMLFLSFSSIFLTGCGTKTDDKEEQPPVTEMKKPTVTGIREFHEVLYPVWHDYFPQGDFQAILDAIPEFKKATKVLTEAELPQFYHNVKDDFESKRENLALSVDKMESVARTGDDKELAEAVEDMHTAFEQMARILAPRIKELEEFHLVLYPLWHQAMPNEDYQAIKSAIPSLESKMDALMSAQLSQRFSGIQPEFVEKREALRLAVDELAEVCRNNDEDNIIQKLTQMHQAYMELDQVFE
ncbi:MAG: hypothetical protein WBD28_09945 [Candidatus Zixiibacteriota bacterium]